MGLAEIAQARACSRPPEPINSTFMGAPCKSSGNQPSIGLFTARPHVSSNESTNKAGENRGRSHQRHPPERRRGQQCAGVFGVRAVVRHQAGAGGHVRLRAPARRDLGLSRRALVRPLLLRAEGRQGQDRRRDLAQHLRGPEVQAGRGAGGGGGRAHHVLPRQVVLPDRHRCAGAGRRRRADGPAGRAQAQARRRGPVRRAAQEAAALPAAGGRHHHLADRCRDSRHAARLRRALPDPRAAVAGAGAGRDLRRRGVGGHPRVQCAARRRDASRGRTC